MTINELMEIRNEYSVMDAVMELISFCNEVGIEEMVADFIHEDDIDDFIMDKMERGDGWKRISCILESINYLDDEYYFIDGYENLRDVKRVDIECIVDDIIRFHDDVLEEEEEEEEE